MKRQVIKFTEENNNLREAEQYRNVDITLYNTGLEIVSIIYTEKKRNFDSLIIPIDKLKELKILLKDI